jgi:acyl carrier protein
VSDKLVNLFAQFFDVAPSTLNDESSPDNTPQWDSLTSMILVAAVEEAFNVQLSTKEIVAMQTIGLVRTVLRRKGVANV